MSILSRTTIYIVTFINGYKFHEFYICHYIAYYIYVYELLNTNKGMTFELQTPGRSIAGTVKHCAVVAAARPRDRILQDDN